MSIVDRSDPFVLHRAGPRVARRTPEAWVDEPYTSFTVRPITPLIGAEISGIELSEPLDHDRFAELNRALLEWKVLFFRHQALTPEQHLAFARSWGPLETHPFMQMRSDQRPQDPEVVRLVKGPSMAGYENGWHSDVTWRAEPSLGSILRAIEVPEVGGDTLWADMGAAYDCLPDVVREQIDGLVAEHDWIMSFGTLMTPELIDQFRPDFPPVYHPVVRTHPETGRKTLYVNRNFTQRILDVDPEVSRELLEILYDQAAFPEYQCRWRWEPGDVAFWDNRSTQHYASSDYFPQRRVMERVTIAGDRPF